MDIDVVGFTMENSRCNCSKRVRGSTIMTGTDCTKYESLHILHTGHKYTDLIYSTILMYTCTC